MEWLGAVAGLQSVARAMIPPWSTKNPAFAKRPSVWNPLHGRMTPMVGDWASATRSFLVDASR